MAVINVPDGIGFENSDIALVRATAAHRSPFTGKRQVVASAYALWQFKGTIVPLQGVDAGKVRSFLVQLGGRKNTFRLPIPAADLPISLYKGPQGLVNGGGQTGLELATDGWEAGKLILADGDYFNIGDELKMATEDITADGSGVARLVFEPGLRESPANNTVVQVRDPFVYLAADNDDVARWALKDFNTHNMKLEATEAVE